VKIYLGVDPGKTGAMCFLGHDDRFLTLLPIPMLDDGKTYNLDSILLAVRSTNMPPTLEIAGAAVEMLHPLPVTMGGSKANYSRGESLAWEWLLRSMGIPVVRPNPQRWQKWAGVIPDRTNGEDTGTKSILEAQRVRPGISLLRTARSYKLDDNMSDAFHLARFARHSFQP
jgi:hypothetical protein